jgi:hypothetical protein
MYFRIHPRSTLKTARAALRRHALADPRVPSYARALMPLVTLAHWAKIRRLTPGGFEDPAGLLLGPREVPAAHPREVGG